ncbi:hypothetical protein MMC27_007933 [Xylographa pallens]|nr:hypothetical protein [Xylographa pallens]
MVSPNPTPVSPLPTSDPALDTSLDADPDIDMTTAPAPTDHPDAADAPLDFGADDGLKDEDFDMDKLHGTGPGPADAPGPDAPLPPKKDLSLRDFLGRMDEYAPIIPDAVTAHALTLAGLPPPPPPSSHPLPSSTTTTTQTLPPHTPLHLSRLLALATQKFIADIAADAYQYSRMRSGNVTSNSLAAQAGGAPGTAPGAGAAPVAGGGAGGGGGGGTAAAALGGGAGGVGKGGEKGAGQHVLGMQRPGFGGGGQGGGQGRTVLTMEDLGMAVGEYGVSVRRGEFYR